MNGDRQRGREQETTGNTHGVRQVVQEAMRRVIEPIFERDFHPSSYATDRGGAVGKHGQAERFLNKYGLPYVVDMDLSSASTSWIVT